MTLKPGIRNQYVELLIKLIETNLDHTWLPYFLRLRTGGQLPGGGAGSLNDWRPSYTQLPMEAWLSETYEVTRYLFDRDLDPEQIDGCNSIKFKNNIRIIRCLNCNKSYQHPRIFESHIALNFLKDSFAIFADNNRLVEILHPERTFKINEVTEYRNWLLNQYDNKNIRVYDFVTANYVCPHCYKKDVDTEHDLYKISGTISGDTIFYLSKQNASWHDFEE